MATKRKEEDEVDPLDLGDDDMEIEYGKMDNLREMLAKSSVAITFKVTRPNLKLLTISFNPFLSKLRSTFHIK